MAAKYLRKFASDGARILPHFRDDAAAVYTPVDVLQNPAKAAALKIFVHYWGLSQAWQQSHQDEFAQGYYVERQGLKLADAKLILKAQGPFVLPRDWRGAVAYQQATIDLIGPQMGHPRFDASTLFDPRFERLAGEAASADLAAMNSPRPSASNKTGLS